MSNATSTRTNSESSARLAAARAKALLMISLTARQDLAIEDVSSDHGYDFFISIVKNASITNRMFAAELKATVRDQGLPLVQFTRHQLSLYKDTPFPVCLFFFFMSNDQGYYKWLVEPNTSFGTHDLSLFVDEQTLKSKDVDSIAFRPRDLIELSPESLDHLIESVNHWYDTRNPSKG